MTRTYFGTDGIRGRVGVAPVTPDFVLRLGYAAGKVLAHGEQHTQSGGHPTVLIGKDTRISGYMLEAALEAGFSAAGVDVTLAGPIPTPGVAYLTRTLRLSAGVVISASHNPYDDNGIKFFSADGNKLPDEVEHAIETQLQRALDCAPSRQLWKARRLDDAAGRYIEFCKSAFPAQCHLHGLRLVVDCAHGAAYHIAPQMLAQAVREHRAYFGIARDGDADRVQMADGAARLYNGDELLYVLAANWISARGQIAGVVGTWMTNLAVEIALKALGLEFERAAVGDRYVLEKLRERNWPLGGEGSGHIVSLDHHTTGDGIISALLVLAALKRSDRTLAVIFHAVQLLPQKLVNAPLPHGLDWRHSASLHSAVDQARAALGEEGRVLIRASGTEPVLRIMVEAADMRTAARIAQSIAAAI